MIIKVCGMRDAANIRAVEALGIDLMGFIFYPKSPRFVAQVPDYLPTRCKRVGVFVNASDDFIAERVDAFHLDMLQLHGNESPERVAAVKARFRLPVIKALTSSTVPCDSKAPTSCTVPCDSIAGSSPDLLIFETKCESYGGSGQQFDWSILQGYQGSTPFLLTGGIGPDDAERIKAFSHPQLAGIDLNSRFELAPAVKDVQALEQFIKKIRQ